MRSWRKALLLIHRCNSSVLSHVLLQDLKFLKIQTRGHLFSQKRRKQGQQLRHPKRTELNGLNGLEVQMLVLWRGR
jgi:hypothetical protein